MGTSLFFLFCLSFFLTRNVKRPLAVCQSPGDKTSASSIKARRPCRLSALTSWIMGLSKDPDSEDAPVFGIVLSCGAWRV